MRAASDWPSTRSDKKQDNTTLKDSSVGMNYLRCSPEVRRFCVLYSNFLEVVINDLEMGIDIDGTNQLELLEHLRNHYPYHCDLCDYASRTQGRLRHHKAAFHSEIQPKNYSGKSSNRPTKSGRTYKCKDCDFSAQDKPDLWRHIRVHMKPERMLECSFCPFVTELAHHFDYHMKNHSGKKPFECDKCNYRCVNKSMLNSHRKSHSNIYQYRCTECRYASKYLHSLKLHLLKHENAVAVVLNADGSLPANAVPSPAQPRGNNQQTPQLLPPLSSNVPPFLPFQFNPLSMPPASHSPMTPSLGFPPGIFPPFPPPPPNLTLKHGSIQTPVFNNLLSGLFSESQPQITPSSSAQLDETPLDLSAPKGSTIETEERESVKPSEYGCSLCSIQLPDSQSASKHLALHDPSDPTRCRSCGFRCDPPVTLNNHLKDSKKCSE
ncbi:unnamed protein product [Rodentolepis nana]|uniref:Protein hunchback n=1 Tax=Rodentolepis nana TaxID=102285 RepID=A0A0R3TWR8_RODNA|nr:unnamed protein product [Rodentolepis nana]